jgi:starvation-inducible DNA-binding protein
MSKNAISGAARLKTPTSLKPKGTAQIAAALNPLIADTIALYFKTKNYHWHLSGADFVEYHELFDQHADDLFETIDVLAERLRKLGETTVRSISHVAKLQTIKDDNEELVLASEMVSRLLADNQHLVESMRKSNTVCSENGDTPTASILDDLIDKAERRVWFLFAISTDGAKAD